jgi:hypothetical protein
MRLFLRSIISIVLLSFGFPVFAQTAYSQQFLFDLKSTQNESLKTKYDILFLLTNGNPKQLSNIKIQYKVFPVIKLEHTQFTTTEIVYLLHNVEVSGDTSYRGFSVAASLIPDCYQGNYRLFQEGKVIQNKQFTVSNLAIGKSFKIGYSDTDRNSKLNLEGDLTGFQFSAQAQEKLENHLGLINDYWSSCLLIDSLMQEIRAYNIANSSKAVELFAYWDKCRKVSKISNEIIGNQILRLNENDPGSLAAKTVQVERLQTRLRTLFDNEMQHQSGFQLSPFANNYINTLNQDRATSLQVGFYDANIFAQAAEIQSDTEFVTMIRMIRSSSGDQILSQLIYSGYFQSANELFQKEDLAPAVIILTDLKRMETDFPEIKVDPRVSEMLGKAKGGLLSSYLQIASRAMNDNNFEMAGKYHRKAEKFRKQYYDSDQLQNSSEVSSNLVQAYFQKAKQLKSENKTDEAIAMFEKALQTSNEFGNEALIASIKASLKEIHRQRYLNLVDKAESQFRDGFIEDAESMNNQALTYRDNNLIYLEESIEAIELQRKIKQPGMYNMIEDGMSAERLGQAHKALDDYQKAIAMADEFQLVMDAPIDSLAQSAARKQIVETIRSANSKVWANKLDEALEISSKASEMQIKYHLESDSLINDEFMRLDKKMIQQACFTHKQKFDVLMEKVEKAIRQKRFDEFATNLQEALDIGNQNQGCQLDLKIARKYEEQFKKLLEYQGRYNRVMQTMYSDGFGNAIESYDQLDKEIDRFRLSDYGLKHLTVLQFIENQQNSGLSRIAFEYFVGKEETASALYSFNLLQKQSGDDEQTYAYQMKLSEMLAIRDAVLPIKNGPEYLAEQYFGSDRRNKSLRQAYLKAYKRNKV